MSTPTYTAAAELAAIADELAGIRELLEQLTALLEPRLQPQPIVQRMHQALGRCWCGACHSFAEAIRLNADIDITQPEGDHHAS